MGISAADAPQLLPSVVALGCDVCVCLLADGPTWGGATGVATMYAQGVCAAGLTSAGDPLCMSVSCDSVLACIWRFDPGCD